MPKPEKMGPEEEPEGLEALRRRLQELEAEKRDLERRNLELVLENTMLRRERKLAPAVGAEEVPTLMVSLRSVLAEWEGVFTQRRVYEMARDLALGFVLNVGRGTLTGVLCALGWAQKDWTRNYRLFSRRPYDSAALFVPVMRRCLEQDRRMARFVAVAVDDSSVRKTGKRIRSAHLLRAPLSEPYWPNLERRQRFVEAAALVRPEGEDGPCRAIPIGFCDAPPAGKPKRGAPAEEWAAYRRAQRRQALGRQAGELAETVASQFEAVGVPKKPVLWCVDGSLTNQTFLKALPSGTEFIGRVRKDSALYAPANANAAGCRDPVTSRVYGERLPTPEALGSDPGVAWQTCRVFAAQKEHWPEFKEIGPVLWQTGTKRRPLRLLVIEPLRYRPSRGARLQYRSPAYLLTSDLSSPAGDLIQAYMDRWEIETVFRDQKTGLGLGQAQVWSEASVACVPAFVVAAHGALLVASLEAFGPHRTEAYGVRPKWRNDVRLRPSLTDLRGRVRRETWGLGHPISCPGALGIRSPFGPGGDHVSPG